MSAIDLDDYMDWLRARGVAEEHLRLYREGAELVLRHVAAEDTVRDVHVEAAIQVEAEAGAPERRLANLRTIGARLQGYVAERHDAAAFAPPPEDAEAALELADVPRGVGRHARMARQSGAQTAVGADGASVRGTMVDDLAMASSSEPVASGLAPVSPLGPTSTPVGTRPSAPSIRVPAMPFTDGPRPGVMASTRRATVPPREERPLPGCSCRTRQDTYPDDYFAAWGKIYLLVSGTVGFMIAIFWSRMAALVVSSALAAIGGVATAATAGWRCSDCRRWIERRGLDEDQRSNELKRRLIFLAIGALALVICVVAVQKVRAQRAEERRALEVLKSFDTDETE